MLIPSSLGGCSSSVLLLAVLAAFGSFWLLLAVFRWSGHAWCARTQLEETGHSWACLNGSRSFGLRQVLAGHPCSHWVGLAHGGSQIDVVEVREQLGGQGRLCVEVCSNMGWVVPPNHPLVVVCPVFHGWSKVQVVE